MINVINVAIQNFKRIIRPVFGPAVIALFAISAIFFAFALIVDTSADGSGLPSQGKMDRLTEFAAENNASHLAAGAVGVVEKNMATVLQDTDVQEAVVRDAEGNVVFSHSRRISGMREAFRRAELESGGHIVGTVSIVFSDFAQWRRAERVTRLMASALEGGSPDASDAEERMRRFIENEDIEELAVYRGSDVFFSFKGRPGGRVRMSFQEPFSFSGHVGGTVSVVFNDRSNAGRQAAARVFASVLYVLSAAAAFWAVARLRKRFALRAAQAAAVGLQSQISPSVEIKLKKAKSYIEANFNRTISREGLARMIGMNPDNFGRYFKLYFGEKINDCVNRLRVDEAAERLSATDRSVLEIAYSVGFENLSTFNRAFAKMRNMTPKDFRKSSAEVEYSAFPAGDELEKEAVAQ